MTESSSFSSLLALVDSHLSKTSIQGEAGGSLSQSNHIQIPSLKGGHHGAKSFTELSFSPGQRMGLPTFQFGNSPINDILAGQVSNMLKAKELLQQKEEELQRLLEKTEKMKVDCVIDLRQAVQKPCKPSTAQGVAPILSTSSSLESLFNPKFIDDDDEITSTKAPEPLLPCTMDMSYILHKKIKRGKCSEMGKVITSRLRPVAAPYLRETVVSDLVSFDFSTPSPCDLIKEKLRKPTSYNTYNFDIFERI